MHYDYGVVEQVQAAFLLFYRDYMLKPVVRYLNIIIVDYLEQFRCASLPNIGLLFIIH